jgi:immune inhibitor A
MVSVRPHAADDLCVMPPAPALRRRLERQLRSLRREAGDLLAPRLRVAEQDRAGFNDGLLFPGTTYPLGTPASTARRAALERDPLRGTVRVVVVLVDFTDAAMPAGAADRFEQLFFSEGALPHGSVREYYREVSRRKIAIAGEVLGPYRMPRTLKVYAGTQNGTQSARPNARTMAADALAAVRDQVDLAPYDNDGNGYVDAFIVVHAGRGAEETGVAGDIWSHKWVLPTEQDVDGTKVFGYLTIPQDARLGVCAHELGHLLFGWPDLYDTDYSSSGIGAFCLMAGGSWGMGGDLPVHPSAWCKTNQGWARVAVRRRNGAVTVKDVKAGGTIHRLWAGGAEGTEYFLLENRQQSGFDASLPAGGLLLWHVDTNTDERHYKVALLQADGKADLEAGRNDGDGGDPWPGIAGATRVDADTTPGTRSYAGGDTGVAVEQIPAAAASMRVRLRVTGTAGG